MVEKIPMAGDDTPVLSIIIPVRNGIEYLRQTLCSLDELQQQLNCELIFQDALSSDGTSEEITEFCRGRNDCIHCREADQGQSDAINRGVRKARGKWVTWLCADDLLFPAVAEALYAGEVAGAEIVYGDVIFFIEGSLIPAIGTEICKSGSLAKSRLIIQQPGTCIKRKTWERLGGVDVSLNWTMDYDLFLRLESSGAKFFRSRSFVALARLHPEAKTSSGSIKRLLELWKVIGRNHCCKPSFFSFKPYLVYLVEFVIKRMESGERVTGAKKRVLPILHRCFWKIARPREQLEIEERFQKVLPMLREKYATVID